MLSDFWGKGVNKAYAARHKFYVRAFSGISPYFIVNEYPKSGGSWLANMLSDALDLPFRRNQPIRLEKSITHGHFLHPFGMRNVVVLWRDPRDVLVSFYYHCYFKNEHNNQLLVKMMKNHLPFDDYGDIRSNLPDFIKFISENPLSPRFSWVQFARVWAHRPGTVQTSYEMLRKDTPDELGRVIEKLTGLKIPEKELELVADKHSFAKAKVAASKEIGAEMSFVREGALGGWRKHFSEECVRVLTEKGYYKCMSLLSYD